MPPFHGKHIQRILIVKPSSLGDIMHTFPAMLLLRRRFPHAKMDWMINPAFADAVLYSPFPVRSRIYFNRKKLSQWKTFIGEFVTLVQTLRYHHYDLVIDFQGLFRSAFFARLTRGSRPIGFAQPREKLARIFYGTKLDVDMSLPAIERNVALVNKLLGTNDPVPEAIPFPVDRFRISRMPKPFRGAREVVALVPGARWQSKAFPIQLFADIINELRARRPGIRFVIVGTRSESKTAHKLIEISGSSHDIITLAGHTGIGEMIQLLHECKLVIGSDSGAGHAAAVLGTPFFGLYGPTDPKLTPPFGARSRIFRRELDCSCCMQRVCPKGTDPECHHLDAQEIACAAAEVLAESEVK